MLCGLNILASVFRIFKAFVNNRLITKKIRKVLLKVIVNIMTIL